MKLLRNFHSVEEADKAAGLLESKGIVTHVSSRNTKTLHSGFHLFVKVGVWAVLEHQYDDAKNLLENDQHVVRTGISEAEMQSFKDVAGQEVFHMLNKAIFVGIGLIVVMVLGFYQFLYLK